MNTKNALLICLHYLIITPCIIGNLRNHCPSILHKKRLIHIYINFDVDKIPPKSYVSCSVILFKYIHVIYNCKQNYAFKCALNVF